MKSKIVSPVILGAFIFLLQIGNAYATEFRLLFTDFPGSSSDILVVEQVIGAGCPDWVSLDDCGVGSSPFFPVSTTPYSAEYQFDDVFSNDPSVPPFEFTYYLVDPEKNAVIDDLISFIIPNNGDLGTIIYRTATETGSGLGNVPLGTPAGQIITKQDVFTSISIGFGFGRLIEVGVVDISLPGSAILLSIGLISLVGSRMTFRQAGCTPPEDQPS